MCSRLFKFNYLLPEVQGKQIAYTTIARTPGDGFVERPVVPIK